MRYLTSMMLAALLAWGSPSWAAPAKPAPVTVSGAWALAGKPHSGLGFVYMTIALPHGQGDSLTEVSTDIASRVEIVAPPPGHPNAAPVTVPSLELDGKAPLVMQTRGTHIILHGLHAPLKPGQSFEITLHLTKAGDVTVPVTTRAHAPEYGMPGLPGGIKLD